MTLAPRGGAWTPGQGPVGYVRRREADHLLQRAARWRARVDSLFLELHVDGKRSLTPLPCAVTVGGL